MHPEQPQRGAEHAAAEPPAGLRPAAGTDCHEDRRPTSGTGTEEYIQICSASLVLKHGFISNLSILDIGIFRHVLYNGVYGLVYP